MTDPRTLTPSAVDQLTGRELAIAVEWFVFGDDLTAKNDDRLYVAMRQFPEHELTFAEADIIGQYDNASPDRGWFLCIWDCRSQLSFCDALEAHVSAWRAEPRELTAELALTMFGEGMPLFPDGINWTQVVRYVDGWAVENWKEQQIAEGQDFTTAVFRAAVKVAMRRQ